MGSLEQKILFTFVQSQKYSNECQHEVDDDSGWKIGDKITCSWGYVECVAACAFACPLDIFRCYKENLVLYMKEQKK